MNRQPSIKGGGLVRHTMAWLSGVEVALVFLVAMLWFGWQVGQTIAYDPTRHSPLRTFHMFLGPGPHGISDIRAAGRSSLGGADIFLRFRATDAAIATLSQEFGAPEVGIDTGALDLWDLQFSRGVLQDQARQTWDHQVHWDEIRRIGKPLVYFRKLQHGNDTLIWDRVTRRAYFYHTNT